MTVNLRDWCIALVTNQLSTGGSRVKFACELARDTRGIQRGQTRPAGGEPNHGHKGGERTEAAFAGARDFEPFHPLGGWPKRLLDISVALAALVLTLPVMIVVAVLITVTSGGSAIFSHNRVGYRGKTFACYKFRTMVSDADAALAAHLARDPQAALEWNETRKLRNDPRVTPLGRFLRKTSLDELPQLINILRGDMSCVGPRPITIEELERYGEFDGGYLSSRPGLSGLWQVTGRSSTDFPTRVALDNQYVRNWSLVSDILILARTPVAVMRTDEVY